MPTTLPSGVIAMGARSYIPQLGRFLQTDPVPGGSANPYAYTASDPVNQTDLSGDYVENDYVLGLGMEQNAKAIELEVAREAAIRKEAEERAREAAIRAKEEAEMAAELAEAEACNLWDAEAAAGPPGSVAGGGMEEEGASGAEMAEIFGCTGGHACTSSVFGAVVHWVSSNAHKLVAAGIGAVSSLVIGAVTLVAVTGCSATAELTEDPFVAYDCYKIGSIGFSVALAGLASSYKAWNVEKN
jgi:hypothetical protein